MDDENKVNGEKPVAYDVQGRPLYLHSEDSKEEPPMQAVHIVRPTEPTKSVVSEAVKLRHERSSQLYPDLSLGEGEYVIKAVRRHSIGLLVPVVLGVIVIAGLLAILVNFDYITKIFSTSGRTISASSVFLPIILVMAFTLAMVYVAYYVYSNNRFYLTNESVIQQIQLTLFSKHAQAVSLADIKDVSYFRSGIFQQLFDYGTICLSTIGDEDTYTFSLAANPKEYIAILTKAVECFKNGRPVDDIC